MKRAKARLVALLLVLAVPVAPEGAFAQGRGRGEAKAEEKSLNLAVGESKTVPALDVKQYSEGTPGIAEIKLTPDGKRFIVTGVKAGTSSLLLIKNDGSQLTWIVKVYSQAPDEVESELAQLLQGYTGIRVRKVGSRLFIEGGVQHEADLNRITQVADLYPGQVESLVTVGTGAVDRNVNIRLDFFFVQYNRSSSYGIGLAWPGRIGGADVLTSNLTFDFKAPSGSDPLTVAQASIVNQPLPALDLASARGWAKVIKQSAVITLNGNEATFSNGGEANFRVSSATEARIEKLEFGTTVTMQPRFDPRSGNIEIKLSADVADLVPSEGLPGRQTTKLSTVIFLKLGESLILSGIKFAGQRHSVIGLPGLSRIPIFGVLFGSHVDQEEETEGAMFVIPSVVESVPKGSYDMVKAAMSQYQNYSGDLDEVNSFPKPPPSYGSTKGGANN